MAELPFSFCSEPESPSSSGSEPFILTPPSTKIKPGVVPVEPYASMDHMDEDLTTPETASDPGPQRHSTPSTEGGPAMSMADWIDTIHPQPSEYSMREYFLSYYSFPLVSESWDSFSSSGIKKHSKTENTR